MVRGGFGIYYGPGQTEDQVQPVDSDRASSTVTGLTCSTGGSTCGATGVQLFAFPAPVAANSPAITSFFNLNPNTRAYQPRAYANNYLVPERIYQYSFSWQQQLPYKLTSTVAYVGSQGRNLFLRSVANRYCLARPPYSTALRCRQTLVSSTVRTPAGRSSPLRSRSVSLLSFHGQHFTIQQPYAEVDYKTSSGRDNYNALQVSIQQPEHRSYDERSVHSRKQHRNQCRFERSTNLGPA